MKQYLIRIVALLYAVPAFGLEPLGDTTGWSGFANLGVGGGEMSSNFLARIKTLEIDMGERRIDDFSEPSGKKFGAPLPALSIGYTFENGKTRVGAGNDLSDFLQFDRTTEFLVRHDFTRLGTLQIAYLNTAMVGTEVWSDPYLVGVNREHTDFDSSGARFTWDKMFGSGFELQASYFEREIDEERSGEDLGLSAAERLLLDRNGDVYRVELGYLASFADGKHIIRPSVALLDRDLDGRAMAQDGYGMGVSYLYTGTKLRWVTNLRYAKLDGDAENPIFGKTNDSDRYSVATQLFFPGALGFEKWVPNVTVLWGQEDSDIEFNKIDFWFVGASLFRKF